MIVADKDTTLILTGNGDVLEPEAGIAAIGSGGNYALAAARALTEYEPDAETLARRAMKIAAEICVYTNENLTIETLASDRSEEHTSELQSLMRISYAVFCLKKKKETKKKNTDIHRQ